MIISEERLICGGRKRGSGCLNRSAGLHGLLRQIAETIESDGFPDCAALLPHLVRRIVISEMQVLVFVAYKKPDPSRNA